ncbi:hypothetical protein ACVWW9_000807 [Agrococcus sp. UYP33]
MRPSPSRVLVTTAIVTLTAMLGACAQAQPGSTSAPARPRSTPTASATPTSTPTPTPTTSAGATGAPGTATPPESDAVELVPFETQNGTMRMQIPADWTVEDSSRVALGYDGLQRWDNIVAVAGPDGGHLWFDDGMPDDVGAAALEEHVVERIDIGSGLAATAWWERYESDIYVASVAVIDGEAPLSDSFRVDGSTRLHFLKFEHPDAEEQFSSRDAVEAYLGSDEVALALDIMATVEISGDDTAVPAGVGVEHEGTTYLPYTTQNGTSTFLVPLEWRIDDNSRVGFGHGGGPVWENWVQLFRPNGGSAVSYVDYVLFAGEEPEWPWTAGEVRPTTDGLHAVSYMLGDTGDYNTGLVGVSLTDQGDASRPTGTVCADTMCRYFVSTPLTEGEAFFGGATEEQLLTVIASLERHHDDARMP